MNNTNYCNVVVIGAGPAGIMAAIFASANGRKVCLLEKNERIGRKVLATGNGRCNLTNRNVEAKNYNHSAHSFIAPLLKKFDQKRTIEFFESLGLIIKEEDRGRIFPRTNQASSVVEVLMNELSQRDVNVKTSFVVKTVSKGCSWEITSNEGEKISARSLIVATGGKAAHQLGSSGDGLFWAKQLGHTISPIYASLVPVETVEDWTKEVQGIKVEARVSVYFDGKIISKKCGDLLFTHFGVSGPAIMSQAREIAPLLEKGSVYLFIDTFPELNESELDKKLAGIFSLSGAKAVKNALLGVAPANLLPVIMQNAGVDPDKKAAEISKKERNGIVRAIKNMKLQVKRMRPLKEAQVTSGGISLNEVNPNTLESKVVKNLYFAGEILDVDGDSGGFNLQWAWSSGYVAGMSASNF